MDCRNINDSAMYDYFEKLIYEDTFSQRGWKKEEDSAPYGLTDQQVRTIHGSKKLLYGESCHRLSGSAGQEGGGEQRGCAL